MDNVYFPIYIQGDMEFIIFDGPGYETRKEARSHAVGDGIMLMASDTTIGFTNRVFTIPCSKEDAVVLVSGEVNGVSIGVCAGELFDKETYDGV